MLRTVFLFDFDDTLLPTYSLHSDGCTDLLSKDASLWLTDEWLTLEKQLMTTLEVCRSRSQIMVIVTNGETNWVDCACKKFYPTLWTYIQKNDIQIFSARSLFEVKFPNDPIAWKKSVFRMVLEQLISEVDRQTSDRQNDCQQSKPTDLLKVDQTTQYQVISIGDSSVERHASFQIGHELNFPTKSIKFIERPSLAAILSQWKLLSFVIPEVHNSKEHLDLMMMPDRSFES